MQNHRTSLSILQSWTYKEAVVVDVECTVVEENAGDVVIPILSAIKDIAVLIVSSVVVREGTVTDSDSSGPTSGPGNSIASGK